MNGLTVVAQAGPSPVPHALIDRIAALLDEGQAGAAGLILATFANEATVDVRVLALSARGALMQGRAADALSLLGRLIEADPTPASPWRDRAACHLLLGRTEAAARDAAEAVVRDPGDADALSLLGRALFGAGRTPEARTCLAAALGANPDDLNAMEALAQAHLADWRRGGPRYRSSNGSSASTRARRRPGARSPWCIFDSVGSQPPSLASTTPACMAPSMPACLD